MYFWAKTFAFLLCAIAIGYSMAATVPPPEDCNMACQFIYRPVCATDGQTYSNRCVMESLSCLEGLVLAEAHDGPCEVLPS